MINQVFTAEINNIPQAETPLGGQARMLVDNTNLRLVNLQLKAGEQVQEHTAPVEVVFIVLEGSGLVQVDKQAYHISAGKMLICPPGRMRGIKSDPEKDLSLLVIRTPNL